MFLQESAETIEEKGDALRSGVAEVQKSAQVVEMKGVGFCTVSGECERKVAWWSGKAGLWQANTEEDSTKRSSCPPNDGYIY